MSKSPAANGLLVYYYYGCMALATVVGGTGGVVLGMMGHPWLGLAVGVTLPLMAHFHAH